MTSESDGTAGRRPPTIELKATEVEKPAPDVGATGPAGEGDKTHEQAGRQTASPWKSRPVIAGLGALAVIAILAAVSAGLWFGGFSPSREAAAPSAAATSTPAVPAPAAGDDIAARLDKIERAIQTPRQEVTTIPPALGNRLAAIEAQTRTLAESLGAVKRRIDDIAAMSQNAAQEAAAAAAAADAAKTANESATQSAVQASDIEALDKQIAAMESAVKTLADGEAHRASSTNDQVTRLTIAAEALRAAVERAAPYQAELTAVRSLGADQNLIAPLEPFASSGVPSAGALGHELSGLIPALERAADTATAGETSFLGRLEAHAQKLVRITPVVAPAGHDPAAVVMRLALDAARADITVAQNDIADLPDAAKPLAADWVKKVQARALAIAASRQIAAAALAALSKPAAQ
ncbi:MAG: hypothetical protein ABSE22_03240 [Xanthobacteraceae bacterium]|jgi:hypothetical protein